MQAAMCQTLPAAHAVARANQAPCVAGRHTKRRRLTSCITGLLALCPLLLCVPPASLSLTASMYLTKCVARPKHGAKAVRWSL